MGYLVTAILKLNDKGEFLERNIMRIGFGIPCFIVISMLYNLCHIPLDWKIYLIFPITTVILQFLPFIKKPKISKPNFNTSNIYIIIVLALFLMSFYMYYSGANKYPYLEDDDPWEHARLVDYISIEKTAYEPSYATEDMFRYTDPYPPAYDILMAVLHQTNDSLHWTLKFFNALIVSISVLFFYFFAKTFLRNESKALIATFVLFVIPCYLSHFIWVHSLIPLLFFLAFYCLEKKWTVLSGIVIASIFLTHPTQSIKFVLFFTIYFLLRWLLNKDTPVALIKPIILGGLISLSWWGFKTVDMFKERIGRVSSLGPSDASFISKGFNFLKLYFNPDMGTATRAYSFSDFFVAQKTNMINNPIGVGIVLCLFLFISITIIIILFKKFYNEKNSAPFIALGWLILTFLLVNAATYRLPGIFPFRTWMLFAIPVALVTAEGVYFLITKYKAAAPFILLIFIVGLICTSYIQKYAVNTAGWPPGAGWSSQQEIQLYMSLKTLPSDTKVMSFSHTGSYYLAGIDKFNCNWCENYLIFRKDFLNKSPDEIHYFLKQNGYQIFVLDAMSFRDWHFSSSQENLTVNTTLIMDKFQAIATNQRFQVVTQNEGGVILRVI